MIIESKQVNLSSNSATLINGSKKSNMVFNLNNILKREKNLLYNMVSVVHAQIPISYYIVNNSNNLLSLSIGDYTLINGNYNASTFKNMVLSLLPAGFTLTLNSSTGIYTMTNTLDFTINATSTCFKLMGFIANTSYSSVNKAIIFPYPCCFLGISRIKLKSSIIQTQNLDTYSKGKSNLLSSIPVNSAQYGLISYINYTNFKSIFPNQNLDYIDIQITDENDNEIDFNGVDNFITLQFDIIRNELPPDNDLISLLEKN